MDFAETGLIFRQARKQAGLTQAELARRLKSPSARPTTSWRTSNRKNSVANVFVNRHAVGVLTPGVSGVQPKLLIRDDGSLGTSTFSPVPATPRVTAQGATHIVKSFDASKLAFEDGGGIGPLSMSSRLPFICQATPWR